VDPNAFLQTLGAIQDARKASYSILTQDMAAMLSLQCVALSIRNTEGSPVRLQTARISENSAKPNLPAAELPPSETAGSGTAASETAASAASAADAH
jgi:hypothetical protein